MFYENKSLHFDPDWCQAPGVHIKEDMSSRSMTISDMAVCMLMSPSEIEDLLVGNIKINKLIANQLESVLGGTARIWLNLEKNYRAGLKKGLKDVTNG